MKHLCILLLIGDKEKHIYIYIYIFLLQEMYLIFTYVIREVVNKIRFLSQVVLYSFNIIRNTLYDLIFYKKKTNTNTRRITWNQNSVQQNHTLCQYALLWRRWIMLYDINTFVQSIKWDFKTTHWHFRNFVSFYNNKKGLKFTAFRITYDFFFKNFVF